MDGIGIGISLISGVLAAIFASLLIRNKAEHKFAFGLTFLFLLAGLRFLGQNYIYPKVYVLLSFKEVEAALLEKSVFQAMKQQEPGTYHTMLIEIKAAMKKNADKNTYIQIGRKHIMEILKRRMALASDASILAYSEVMLQELRELKSQGDDICHRFIFDPRGDENGAKYFKPATLEADLNAIAVIFNSSSDDTEQAMDDDSIARKLEPLLMEIAHEYGPDVAMLQEPNAPNVKKGKLCDMTIKLYSKVNQLPPRDSSRILRSMWAKSL